MIVLLSKSDRPPAWTPDYFLVWTCRPGAGAGDVSRPAD